MTLRELMIERLNYAFTEDEIEYEFDVAELEGDLTTISDEDFLEFYDNMFTY